MGLGREVHDRSGPVLAEGLANRRALGDVGLNEGEARMRTGVAQALEVARVGEVVEDDHPVRRLPQGQADVVRADDPAPPRVTITAFMEGPL